MTTPQARITELYEGRVGSPAEQRLVAARVHWMIAQGGGADLLDVGCGQGIAALLAAREGRRAIGIDRDPAAIEWARARAKAEQEAVRSRLAYELMEAGELSYPDDSFDAVLLGGVLEEQVDPTPIVREALRVLRPDGRLVITALYAELSAPPFGEPLYLKGLIELLGGSIEVTDIVLLDRYMAVAGVAVAEGATKPSPAVWMRALDAAERNVARLLAASLQSGAELDATTRRREELERAIEERVASAQTDAGERLAAATEDVIRARERLAGAEVEREAARRDADQLRQRLELSEGRTRELQGELAAHSARLARLDAELEGLRQLQGAAPAAEQRRLALEEESSRLRSAVAEASQRAAAAEAERDAVASELTVAVEENRRLDAALAAEHDAARAAREEAAAHKVGAVTAGAELSELTATVERLKATLAVQTGRIGSLEEAIAAAESDHKRLDQRWRHATDRAAELELELSRARDQIPRPPASIDAELAELADPSAAPPAATPVRDSALPPARPPSPPSAPASRAERRPDSGGAGSDRGGEGIRILHLLGESIPHAVSSIAASRHGLLRAQLGAGLDVSAMTGLNFPWTLDAADPPSCEVVDDVAYYRLHDLLDTPDVDELAAAIRIAEQLLPILEPQILHAASMEVAPLAIALATRHSLRCVIELTGDASSGADLDPALLAQADGVVALSAGQRERALRAGVPEDRLTLIPAFVDASRFASVLPTGPGSRPGPPVLGVVAYRDDSAAIGGLREAMAGLERPACGLVVSISAPGAHRPGDEDHDPQLIPGEVAQRRAGPDDVPLWLARMDVVIAATPYEALDAMAAARAVLGVQAATEIAPGLEDLPRLLADRRRRARRGAAGRREIEAEHTGAALEAYARLYAVQASR